VLDHFEDFVIELRVGIVRHPAINASVPSKTRAFPFCS